MPPERPAPPLLPFRAIDANVEGLTARHRRGGVTLYLTVVLALLAAAAALPFVEVDVNSRSRGLLRPATKMTPLVCPVGGTVIAAHLPEDGAVTAGDTLLVVSAAELDTERGHLREEARQRQREARDLDRIVSAATAEEYPSLESALYQRDYRDYRRRRAELHLRVEHARRHRDRQQELLASGAIARMELEQADHELALHTGQLAQLTDRQRHLWTQEQQRTHRELADLRRRLRQLAQRAAHHVVTAPLTGHLTQTYGVQPGGYVAAGQTLARVSPAGELRVEAYVDPADIGLLRVGLPVRLQLDAFNHHQWGLARATLTEIGTDVTEVDGAAAFRVICQLHDRQLQLRNGYAGELRKGMTLTAHFRLARRTLFQLLHDKVDDWFNPSFH